MPDQTYRVAIVGLSHDHVWWNIDHWTQAKGAEIVAACDAHAPLLEKFSETTGVTATYGSYEELFDQEQPDIVAMTLDNAGTLPAVEAVAARGIHIVSEKPMAATLAQADGMLEAARDAGVQLMINWPMAWSAGIQTVCRLVQEGAIGRVWSLQYRAAHAGPKEIGCSPYFYEWLYDAERNGGGAFIDFCSYGAALSAHLLGPPESVTGIRGALVKQDFPVDDNGVVMMRYPNAYALAIGSWTEAANDGGPNPVVHGEEGSISLLAGGDSWQPSGKVRLARHGEEPRLIDCDTPAKENTNGAEHLLAALRAGRAVTGLCSAGVGRMAQAILDAGLRSADSGQTVRLEAG